MPAKDGDGFVSNVRAYIKEKKLSLSCLGPATLQSKVSEVGIDGIVQNIFLKRQS